MSDYGYAFNCLVGEVRRLREEQTATREGLADVAAAIRELAGAVLDHNQATSEAVADVATEVYNLRPMPRRRRWFRRTEVQV